MLTRYHDLMSVFADMDDCLGEMAQTEVYSNLVLVCITDRDVKILWLTRTTHNKDFLIASAFMYTILVDYHETFAPYNFSTKFPNLLHNMSHTV